MLSVSIKNIENFKFKNKKIIKYEIYFSKNGHIFETRVPKMLASKFGQLQITNTNKNTLTIFH